MTVPGLIFCVECTAWVFRLSCQLGGSLLSIHARVEGTEPSTWEDSSLVQIWGPRHHAYVVPARDLAVFSLGRLPDEGGALRVAEDLAVRVRGLLGGARMAFGEAGRALGEHNANRLRYAAPTQAPRLPRGFSRAATRISFSREAIVNSWSPTPLVAASSGRLAFGRAASWPTARSSGRGDVRWGQ